MTTTIELDGMPLTLDTAEAPRPLPDGGILVTGELGIGHGLGDVPFYRHGWNSWSPSGWRRLGHEPLRIYDNPERLLTADDAATDTPGEHTGSAVGALELPDGRVLLVGALGLGAPRVGADLERIWGRSDDPHIDWFVAVGDEHVVFSRYVSLLSARFGRAAAPTGPVWSSWYSYFEDIDEATIARVVRDLEGYPFDVIQVDDGWEQAVGDWDAGDAFPSGLAALASGIRSHGFRPGLWLAPLICLPGSRVAREHPGWLVRGDDDSPLVAGHNWGSAYFALDTTLPDVQAHLTALFARLRADGFDYFKLDFMYAGALPGRRAGEGHREVVFRDAVRRIRDAVGPEAYLLGSGVPMIPSIGLFDGARIGPDVAPYWDNSERKRDPSGAGALNSLRNSVERLWMRGLYDLDPDVVFFRTRRNLLDEEANQVLIDLADVAGFKATSDPISWLLDDERAALRAFLTEHPEVVRLSRYRYRIGDREVDFGTYINATGRVSDRLLVK